ncbi:hypothetical protein LWM68_00955 [Niabella sp. W65]|nr:hypothetical protein [Niabella sp. W65]MCH7361475.1 hypothetical protein [Niabella sp. W65]
MAGYFFHPFYSIASMLLLLLLIAVITDLALLYTQKVALWLPASFLKD